MYDGRTPFGWARSSVDGHALTSGYTTTTFCDFDLCADIEEPGLIMVGKERGIPVGVGLTQTFVSRAGPGQIHLFGARARAFCIRPALSSLPLEEQAKDWKVIPHAKLPPQRQTTWQTITRNRRTIGFRALGGPGCLELAGLWGDFVLQLDVNCRKPLTNGGVFFRSRPGDFLNGYEAQVFNGFVDGDPAKPARWCTGAIDDRKNARRLVSRDGQPFTMTIVATGPHIATWVNGVQVTDWTDTRPPHDNPRQGLRLEPGTIQLQAHDAGTDIEFTNIRIAPRAQP